MNIQTKGRDNKFYTVGLDVGSLKLDGFAISLFGTPGLMRFKIMRDIIAAGSDGVLFIFDANHPEKDKKALTILNSINKVIKPKTPIVYLANKHDIEGARSPEIIKRQNKLPKDSKIFPTSTKTGLNVKESMKYLVDRIFERYKKLINLLSNYETDIRGLAMKLKKNKNQMRDLLNRLELKRFITIDRLNRTYKVNKELRNLT